MSRLDEPVDRGHVVQSARMTVAAHYRGTCQCCAPDGCPQLDWARRQLTPAQRRPAAPDGRRSKENSMTTGQWTKPNRCDNSGPNCVEVNELPTGERVVRNSRRPEITVKFDAREWEAFTASVRDGQF